MTDWLTDYVVYPSINQFILNQTTRPINRATWFISCCCIHVQELQVKRVFNDDFTGLKRIFCRSRDHLFNWIGLSVGGAEFARNWICKERGWKLQGKEYSRKGLTIRICVNLQGMDLSRKSRSGICKEQYLQGKEFARNGISKERGWNLKGMDFARNADYVVSITVP